MKRTEKLTPIMTLWIQNPKPKNYDFLMLNYKTSRVFRAGVPNLWYAHHLWYAKVFQVVRE